jgi:hypothetical protein
MVSRLYNNINIYVAAILLSFSGVLQAQKIELIPFIKNGVWGYCDTSLVIKINPQFDLACPFDPNGLAIIYKKQQNPDTLKGNFTRKGYFGENAKDEIIINPVYRCNLIDKNGKLLSNEWFDNIIERGQSYTLINYKKNLSKELSAEVLSSNKIELSGRNSIKNSCLLDIKGNVLRKSEGLNYLLENNLIVNDYKNTQTIYNLKGEIIHQLKELKIVGSSQSTYLAYNDSVYYRLNNAFKIQNKYSRNPSKDKFNDLTNFLLPFNISLENFPINEFIGFKFEKYEIDPVKKDSWYYIKSEIHYVNEMGEEFFDNSYGFIDSTGLVFLGLNEKEKKRFSNGVSSIKSSFCKLCYENFIDKKGSKIPYLGGIGNQSINKFSPLNGLIGVFKYGLTFYYTVTLDNPESGDNSSLSEELGFMTIKGEKFKIK